MNQCTNNKIVVSGLKNRIDLNGAIGIAEETLSTGRLKVRIISSDEIVLIKPENAKSFSNSDENKITFDNLNIHDNNEFDKPISINMTIIVSGLQKRADLNGELGVVETKLESGRFQVRIASSQEIVLIKPENIEFLNDNENKCDEVLNAFCGSDVLNESSQFQFFSKLYVWSKDTTFFYPFGNTPAKLLIQHIPVNQPTAAILLLGCGDPRHIMYTAHCIVKQAGLALKQRLDIVCCDLEASIVARNIILFKLIHSLCPPASAWHLFYYLYLDSNMMQMLVDTAQSLLALGETYSEWHSTSFGQLVSFANKSSFTQVRAIWNTYAKGPVDASKATELQTFRKPFIKPCLNYTAASQAVPAGLQAVLNQEVHSSISSEYATSGVLQPWSGPGGGVTAKKGSGRGGGEFTLVNPLMCR